MEKRDEDYDRLRRSWRRKQRNNDSSNESYADMSVSIAERKEKLRQQCYAAMRSVLENTPHTSMSHTLKQGYRRNQNERKN